MGDDRQPLQFRVNKRVSPESDGLAYKRRQHGPRTSFNGNTKQIDNIPVLSIPVTDRQTPGHAHVQLQSSTFSASALSVSTSSHAVSTASSVFSSASVANTSFSSVNTDDLSQCSEDEYKQSTQDERALQELIDRGEYDFLVEAYKISWPSFDSRILENAPFGIVWDFTRLANGQPIDTTPYSADDTWHQQDQMRHIFPNNTLSDRSSTAAWNAALQNCVGGENAVVFSGTLVKKDESNQFDFQMSPMTTDRSYRLQRRFGADRFLEMTLSIQSIDDIDTFISWLSNRQQYFLGRRWFPFFVKDVSNKTKTVQDNRGKPITRTAQQIRIYMFASGGDSFRRDSALGSDASASSSRVTISRDAFLQWAIGAHENKHQPICKLFSRLSLNLSRTIATVILESHQIQIVPDILSPTGEVMTDGIGRMSRILATKIAQHLGIRPVPCAFQARIGGAKGVWIIDDERTSDDTWIEISKSQVKWDCAMNDPHHRTFEVLRWPKPISSAELSTQMIPILEAGSLNKSLFRSTLKTCLTTSLQNEFNLDADSIHNTLSLLKWVEPTSTDDCTSTTVPYAGSLPKSLSEQVRVLISAGFTITNKKLQECIKELAHKRWRELEERMRIGVPCSTSALMVADFTGVLEADEVHFSFSTSFDDGAQFNDTLLEGRDVLVSRNPAHLPSDIQKVRAVSRPELRHLKDVIVFSTKGNTPLASLLSGGDYDGDIAWVCWDASIVSNFTACPLPPRPTFYPLQKIITTLSGIYNDLPTPEGAATDFLTQGLKFNAHPSLLGICTKYKESLCYKYNSITCTKAINMSYLLSDLVDQAKQGTVFTQKHWKAFQSTILNESSLITPAYDTNSDESTGHLIRPTQHILDFLKGVCTSVSKAARHTIDCAIPEYKHDRDLTDLVRYYNESQNPMWKHVLSHIQKKLDAIEAIWKATSSTSPTDGKHAVYSAFLNIKPPQEYQSHPEVVALLQPYVKDHTMSEWSLLKASKLYRRHGICNWVWYAAGAQLCQLKVRQRIPSFNSAPVTVDPRVYAVLKPNKKRIDRLNVTQTHE